MSEEGDLPNPLDNIARRLGDFMQREVTITREILSNMQQEQNLLLACKMHDLRQLMKERKLLTSMGKVREYCMKTFKELAQHLHISISNEGWEKQVLEKVLSNAHAAGCEILWLRDQLLALLSKMNERNSRNNYLIHSRIRYTKDLMRRLDPQSGYLTYGSNGKHVPKAQVATMTLINHEG